MFLSRFFINDFYRVALSRPIGVGVVVSEVYTLKLWYGLSTSRLPLACSSQYSEAQASSLWVALRSLYLKNFHRRVGVIACRQKDHCPLHHPWYSITRPFMLAKGSDLCVCPV